MKFRFKGFTSLLLACCFLVASISGIVLFVTPKGRVANWTNWTMLGLDKHGWGAVHMNACLLVLIAAGVHLVLNWKVFLSYIKRKATGLNLKLEMAAAVLITAVAVTGTVLELQPFSSTMALNETIKRYWERQAPTGPAPHAEEFSVATLSSNLGLSVNEVTTALEQEGVVVEDAELSIGELAEQSGIAPSDIFAAIQKHYPDSAGDLHVGPGRGRGMGQGRGRGMGGGPWHQSAGDNAGHLTEPDLEGDHGTGPGRGQGRGQRGWGQGQRQGRGLRRGAAEEPAHDQD